jgi:phosphatidyl-N-methylethanolamine N-methyltransferase
MSLWLFLVAALTLSLERVVYVWASRDPESFRAWCLHVSPVPSDTPVTVPQKLFYGFKGIQIVAFLVWCVWHQQGAPSALGEATLPLTVGGSLLVIGQVLDLGVFYRLGMKGVFYGNRFGEKIPRKTVRPGRASPFAVDGGAKTLASGSPRRKDRLCAG